MPLRVVVCHKREACRTASAKHQTRRQDILLELGALRRRDARAGVPTFVPDWLPDQGSNLGPAGLSVGSNSVLLATSTACGVCPSEPSVRHATAAQMPMARARPFGSTNVCTMIDMATGFIMEPPSAWITRAVTNDPMPAARLHKRDPSVNRAIPTWNTPAAEAIRRGPAQH